MKEKENSDSLLLEENLHSEDFLPAVVDTGRDVVVYDDKAEKLSPFIQYIKQINKYKLLSPEQEKALTKALKETGDIEIAKKLVLHNLRLVVKIAMEYRNAHNNVMDLIQEGNIGLMKAVSKYDPEKGAKLSYYSSWWIRSYILKFILDNFRLVKIGTTNEQKKLFYNLLKERDRLTSMGIVPDNKAIAENLGVSESSVALMSERLGAGSGDISLDAPLSADEGGKTLADIFSSESRGEGLEEEISHQQEVDILKKHLEDFLATLKERDRYIFKKRLLSEVPPSLQKIADEFGVSRERIRQIEERLLKKLKVYMSEFLR